jgi:mannosyltransferase OCH1-like enzyme
LIPQIIHQTWKTSEIPDHWKEYQASWRRAHPGWEYRLWTDRDSRELIATRHPWFLPTYDAFPRQIQRVDASKYFILYSCGGVYADLDCECLKPLGPLLAGGGAVVSRTRDGVIDCAIMASSIRHPFWESVFHAMQHPTLIARVMWHVRPLQASHVLFTTGTRMMKRLVAQYERTAPAGALTVCDARFLSARSWLDRYEAFDEPDAYVRHHYSDSWLRPGEQRVHRWLTRKVAWRTAAGLLALAGVLALLI